MTQAELIEKLDEMERRLKSATLYEMLGVSPTATDIEVRAAYRQAAKIFHLDNYGGQSILHLAPRMQAIMGELTKAQAKLTNPTERAEYDAKLALQASGVPTDVRLIFEADEAFKAGRRLLERNNFADALGRFKHAGELYPGEAEYQSYLRWTEYCTLETDREGRPANQSAVSRLRGILVEIAEKNPKQEAACVFVGHMYRNEGNTAEAQNWYRMALTRNPENLDARSALRLLNMRSQADKKPEGNFFTRLFGKK
jgi:curved DNA-binding protein CbpA